MGVTSARGRVSYSLNTNVNIQSSPRARRRRGETVRDRTSDLRVFLPRRWDRVGWRRDLAFSEYSGSVIREGGSMCAELRKTSTYQLRTRRDRIVRIEVSAAVSTARGLATSPSPGDAVIAAHYAATKSKARLLSVDEVATKYPVATPGPRDQHRAFCSHAFILALSLKTHHHPHRRAATPMSRACLSAHWREAGEALTPEAAA